MKHLFLDYSLTSLLFSPKGRIPRSLYVLGLFIAYLIFFAGLNIVSSASAIEWAGIPFMVVAAYSSAVLLYKRLKDTGRVEPKLIYFSAALMIVPPLYLALLLAVAFTPGTPGENRYGPPLGKTSKEK